MVVYGAFHSKIRYYENDKEWMTEELRQLRRQKAREYKNHKKSSKFIEMHTKFLELKRKNSEKYIEKEIESLKQSNPREFYKRIKKVGARLGECETSNVSIPAFIEEKLNSEQEANRIASYFSKISQEYTPLNVDNLPTRVKEKLKDKNILDGVKVIEAFQVYDKFKKRKLKKNSV